VTAGAAGPGLLGLLLAGLTAATAMAADACEAPGGFEARGRLAAADVVLLYRTRPATIELGQHFAVEAIVCTPAAGPPATGLRVDARMPEHRHGMNYRPRVSPVATGRFVAEGLLFHMPGRWQLLFDVERGGRTDRLAADLVVP
jgi:hypothetical protein